MNNHGVLLGVLYNYAPDMDAQVTCSTMFQKAVLDGATERELDVLLIGALSDGLKYGNWPWSKPSEEQK